MTVCPPQALAPSFTKETGLNILEYEMMSERADSLGRHGLKVEKALALLSGRLADGCPPEEREALLDDAADKVWAFFIQREMCGLRSQKDAIRRYGIHRRSSPGWESCGRRLEPQATNWRVIRS